MSEQLPPVDPAIRHHLTRRSSGRCPDYIMAEVSAALDAVEMERPRRLRLGSSRGWPAPRLVAAAAVAFAIVLVGAVLWVPRILPAPAASSSNGVLSTAELASLLSGEALPANTTLAASVTIDARTDACPPMDRYPTIGVVEGMASQVCVMGDGAASYLNTPTVSGYFAFRYLAPGVLGLIGQLTPASATLGFHVAEDWPLAGKTFLVEGWLGAEELTASCAFAPTFGDVLNPTGEDCPYADWLSDDPSAPGVRADYGYIAGSPAPSYDPLSLRGNARHVEAGGMRLIDSIDPAAPAYGVYVVRSVVEQCSGAPVTSSRGCGVWRVLARVAAITLHAPTVSGAPGESSAPTEIPIVTPAPAAIETPAEQPTGPLSPAPTGIIGAGNAPLTAAELETLMVTRPDRLAGRVAIVQAPIPTQIVCQSDAAGGGCVVDDQPLASRGIWAIRVQPDGALTLLGQVTLPDSGGDVFTLDEAQARQLAGSPGHLLIVDAWLGWEASLACDTPPYPSDSLCGAGAVASLLVSQPVAALGMYPDIPYPLPSGVFGLEVKLGDYQIFGSQDPAAGPVHGVYLVQTTDPNFVEILARLEPSP
jgi:hypothetical protein